MNPDGKPKLETRIIIPNLNLIVKWFGFERYLVIIKAPNRYQYRRTGTNLSFLYFFSIHSNLMNVNIRATSKK